MGCSYSSPTASSPPSDCVRVVRITGHVEDLRMPVTAGQLMGRPPEYVLISSAHLAAFGTNPIRADDCLVPGRIYFLLPHAVLLSASSAVELATLMARLKAAAAKRRPSAVRAVAEPDRQRDQAWKPELDSIEERQVERTTVVARARPGKRTRGGG